MMHLLCSYDVMLHIVMLLPSVAVMRCLPTKHQRSVIIHKVNIIGVATSYAEGKHHSKKKKHFFRSAFLFGLTTQI